LGRVALVRLTVDFRQDCFAHGGRGWRRLDLTRLSNAHKAAIIAHVGADEIRRPAIAAQKPLGAR